MPWVKGQSGNPSGAAPPKRFAAALDRAIAQGDGKKLRDAAEQLLDQAAAGEQWAIAMLADRIDGKVPQAIEGGLSISLHEVMLDAIDPESGAPGSGDPDPPPAA